MVFRHYTGKHGILERYLREALAEKGITYNPNENGKRRNSDSSNGHGRAKAPRLSVSPTQNGTTVVNTNQIAVTEINENGVSRAVTVATRPNTEELRKEVEAMMRSFQPVVEQPIVLQAKTNGNVAASSQVAANGGTVVVTTPASSNATSTSSAVLPTIVLSAVANATAASVASRSTQQQQQQPVVTLSLPTQPANVPTITVNNQQNQKIPSFTSSQPLPLEALINNGSLVVSDGTANGQTLPSIRILKANSIVLPSSPVVENEDVMWSAANNGAGGGGGGGGGTANGNNSAAVSTRSSSSSSASSASSGSSASSTTNGATTAAIATTNGAGPAVVVEAAHSVPVYIENVDANAFTGSTVNLDNIDYDYLYTTTATNHPTNVTEVRERQLDFCML